MHILSPETDNYPSWISGRERMTVENISRSISTKECCRPQRGLNPRPPGLQSDAHPTEPPRPNYYITHSLTKHWLITTASQSHSLRCWLYQEVPYKVSLGVTRWFHLYIRGYVGHLQGQSKGSWEGVTISYDKCSRCLLFQHYNCWKTSMSFYIMNYAILFVLRFYGPVNPMGSCRAWSV